MTKVLLSLVLIAFFILAFYWVLSNFIPGFGFYAWPIAILLGAVLGFYVYTLIDNRIG